MNEKILRALQGKATAAEEQEMAAWRAAATANEEQFRAAERLWNLAGVVEPAAEPLRPTAAELLRRGEARTEISIPRRTATGQTPRRAAWAWRGAAAAAAVLLLFALGRDWIGGYGPTAGRAEFATASGEMQTVRLQDGSVVRLAPNSRLRVQHDSGREVWLDGRAFFAVTKRDGQPFVVYTDAGRAQVLGTRFELRTGADEVRLAVVEGRVALAGPETQVEVGVGEVSQVARGQEPTPALSADVESLLQWMGRTLIFETTPLRQAAAEIERAYGVPVLIADPALADRTVSVVFEDRELEDVTSTVCRVVGIRCSVEDTLVVIGR